MVAFFILSLLALFLLFAGLELLSRYRAEGIVGSEEWKSHQLRLREHVDALADGEDERKRELYKSRLELGATRGVYADEEERRRAQSLKLHQNLYHRREQTELSQALHRARQDE